MLAPAMTSSFVALSSGSVADALVVESEAGAAPSGEQSWVYGGDRGWKATEVSKCPARHGLS